MTTQHIPKSRGRQRPTGTPPARARTPTGTEPIRLAFFRMTHHRLLLVQLLVLTVTSASLPRRTALRGLAGSVIAQARPASAAPFEWSFAYGSERDAEPKRRDLSVDAIAAILRRDLAEKKYILTGQLSPSIFSDDCRFVDPNNAVDGLSKYRQVCLFVSLCWFVTPRRPTDRIAPCAGRRSRCSSARMRAPSTTCRSWCPRVGESSRSTTLRGAC